nr:immunoglobulin heavy chain junction region [Mus musculus]
ISVQDELSGTPTLT